MLLSVIHVGLSSKSSALAKSLFLHMIFALTAAPAHPSWVGFWDVAAEISKSYPFSLFILI